MTVTMATHRAVTFRVAHIVPKSASNGGMQLVDDYLPAMVPVKRFQVDKRIRRRRSGVIKSRPLC